MNRATLAKRFAEPSPAPLKTFVVEAHPNGDRVEYLRDVGADLPVESTEDRYLFRMGGGELEFFVDTLDDRFWSFHTWSKSGDAQTFLKAQLESRRDLDWMWLPSQHLKDVWPTADLRTLLSDFRGQKMLPDGEVARDVRVRVDGADSAGLLKWISSKPGYAPAVSVDRVAYEVDDPDFGHTTEALHRLGRFVAAGDSFELHQEIVRRVTSRYRDLVELIETRTLSFEPLAEGGLTISGGPVLIRYRPVPDMGLFVDEMFSGREPFRLWGAPEEEGEAFHVDAVDLHVGQRIAFDIAQTWLRLYLPQGSCGNTAVRLVANLQHRFDGQVFFGDRDLQSAFDLLPVSASASSGVSNGL